MRYSIASLLSKLMDAATNRDFRAFCLTCDLLVAQGLMKADATFEEFELAIAKLEISESAGLLAA